MQPLFEHRLHLAGYRTRALELEGDGPPLLLLHGYSDSADTWRILLDRLGRADRRAVALDMPGFGTCDRLNDHEPILVQLERFAHAALEWFAPEGGAVVCGNSLGGLVSLLLAERDDLKLTGVVPVAPAGLDMARWFTVIERDQLLRALLAAPVPIPRAVLRRTVAEVYKRLAFHRPADVDPRVAATFASHFADRAVTGRILATGRRLLPELRDCLEPEKVDCPVLLVWGTRDVMVYRTGAQRVLDAVPGSRLVTLENCGHSPQIEAPDRLAELVLDFPASLAHAA
jgi:pimeloyl-ACP methyl ester carboxylesterase